MCFFLALTKIKVFCRHKIDNNQQNVNLDKLIGYVCVTVCI